MRCERARELMSAKLDGELTEKEELEMLRHLEHCPSCRQIRQQYEFLEAHIGTVASQPPEDLTKRILAQTGMRPAPRKKRRVMWGAGTVVAAAAALFLLVASGSIPLPQMDSKAEMEQVTMDTAAGEAAEEQNDSNASAAPEESGNAQLVLPPEDMPDSLEDATQAESGESTGTADPNASKIQGGNGADNATTWNVVDTFELSAYVQECGCPVLVLEMQPDQVAELSGWEEVAPEIWQCLVTYQQLQQIQMTYGGQLYADQEDAQQAVVLLIP